jgi:hypothetical protein
MVSPVGLKAHCTMSRGSGGEATGPLRTGGSGRRPQRQDRKAARGVKAWPTMTQSWPPMRFRFELPLGGGRGRAEGRSTGFLRARLWNLGRRLEVMSNGRDALTTPYFPPSPAQSSPQRGTFHVDCLAIHSTQALSDGTSLVRAAARPPVLRHNTRSTCRRDSLPA